PRLPLASARLLAADTGTGVACCGKPARFRLPNGFCPKPFPPSVETLSLFMTWTLFPGCPPAAGADRNIRFSAQKHHRLRITAILEKMHQLRVQPRPAALQKLIQPQHLVGNRLAITSF